MQQQAALVAAHSAYLSPMATMAAVQMQHMAAVNANGLIATPITPASGKALARQLARDQVKPWGAGGAGGGGVRKQPGAPLCLPELPPGSLPLRLPLCSVAVMFSFLGTSTPPAIAATPVSAIPAALGVNGYSPVPTQPTGQPAPDALYPNGVHPYPGGAPCLPTLLCQPPRPVRPLRAAKALLPAPTSGLKVLFLALFLGGNAPRVLSFLTVLFLKCFLRQGLCVVGLELRALPICPPEDGIQGTCY